MWARACLLVWAASLGACVPRQEEEPALTRIIRQQPSFGITHLDIRDAILALSRSIKAVSNKLDRHEAREAQLGASISSSLASLASGIGETGGGVQTVARQVALLEERLRSMETMVQVMDEMQRKMLTQLTQGLDRLLARDPNEGSLPPLPGGGAAGGAAAGQDSAVLKVVKKLNRKLTGVEAMLQNDMRAVTNEVTIVGEALGQHMEQLRGRHDRLETELDQARDITQTSFKQLADSLAASSSAIQEQIKEGQGSGCETAEAGSEPGGTCLEALDRHARLQEETLDSLKQETQKALEQHLATLQTVLLEAYASQALLNASVVDLTHSLDHVNASTQAALGKVAGEVVGAVQAGLEGAVTSLRQRLDEDTTNIMDMLDDRASQTENLHNTVLENYSELTSKFDSLKKVEQVMIHTADSVLDTKRSIEFGIQQIILELGEIVKSSGSTINTTLFDQINSISFAILKNQTSALTNMTAKMEQEISQVWRQIGIMYQQMSQSVDLLDQLRDTTKQHMNASLSRVGDMDGTVGKINTKVADVESNLNYLLGRLSLVASEFRLMKSDVGDKLTRLRDNMANTDLNPVEFDGGDPHSASHYDVNRKREAVPNPEYRGSFPAGPPLPPGPAPLPRS